MRKRSIGKFIRLNEEENKILKEKSSKVGKTESGYIRSLILGYQPKEQPTEIIFEMMNQIRAIGTNLNQIARKANALDMIDVPYFRSVYEKICKLEKRLNEKLLDRK